MLSVVWCSMAFYQGHKKIREGVVFQIRKFACIEKDALTLGALLRPDMDLHRVFLFDHIQIAVGALDIINAIKFFSHSRIADIQVSLDHGVEHYVIDAFWL